MGTDGAWEGEYKGVSSGVCGGRIKMRPSTPALSEGLTGMLAGGSLRRIMDANSLVQSPFAVLTFIAAPALLTNASSVLALSTTNRMLHTRQRMQDLYTGSEAGEHSGAAAALLVAQVNRVEEQAVLLLNALRSVYVALGSFAGATLVTLLGAGLTPEGEIWFHVMAAAGVLLGLVGVGGLVMGSVHLFHATQLSMASLREEAKSIRERQQSRAEEKGGGS